MLPYSKVDQWPSIPRAGLLTRFNEKKVVFARSDESSASLPFKVTVEDGDALFVDEEVPV